MESASWSFIMKIIRKRCKSSENFVQLGCVLFGHTCAKMNRSRCCLRADSRGSKEKEPCIKWGSISPARCNVPMHCALFVCRHARMCLPNARGERIHSPHEVCYEAFCQDYYFRHLILLKHRKLCGSRLRVLRGHEHGIAWFSQIERLRRNEVGSIYPSMSRKRVVGQELQH